MTKEGGREEGKDISNYEFRLPVPACLCPGRQAPVCVAAATGRRQTGIADSTKVLSRRTCVFDGAWWCRPISEPASALAPTRRPSCCPSRKNFQCEALHTEDTVVCS
jgi:hypothetical protein